MLLSEARTRVLEFLDDDNSRWSTSQVDAALKYALSSCVEEYTNAGGHRLHKVVTLSSTTSGEVDLSSYTPTQILGVTLSTGGRVFPLSAIDYEERGVVDDQVRSITIRYMPTFTLPSNASHPLVGVGATAANSWEAFEHWICVRAANYASTKDAEIRPDLEKLELEARDVVMLTAAIPKALPFPSKPNWYSAWIKWAWKADDKKIILCRSGWLV